ncbi:MAG: hypothetical protein M3N98_01235 [Actinomycetota bacterium]|nr:hypothetical protein [Actinomycetota bacterium]
MTTRVRYTGPPLTTGHPLSSDPVLLAQRWLARAVTRLKTTPGRMRLASAAIVAGLIVLSAIGVGAFGARQHAGQDVGVQAEPLLVGSEVIYSRLADADATAAGTFLTPGQEPPQRRARYLDDMKVAADQLASVTSQVGTSSAGAQAAGQITHDLPIYAGLIEAARANNRQGLPVGAAYLREGSALMRNEILPSTGKLYQVEANRLAGAYRSGGSKLDTAGVTVAAAVALVLLIVTQLYLFRRTNRLLNLPLVVATVLVALAGAWAIISFNHQAGHLDRARITGSDPIQLLSSARILSFRAQGDEGLALVARGSGSSYLADLDAIVAQLGPADGSTGLIRQAMDASGSTGFPVLTGSGGLYPMFLDAHSKVQAAANGGRFGEAVVLATGTEVAAADKLTQGLDAQITLNQQAFNTQARAARSDLRNLAIGMPLLIVVAGLLTLFGLQLRINEYR